MKKLIVMLFAVPLVTCAQSGSSLSLMYAVVPDPAQCSFSADTTHLLSGLYDPTGGSYVLGVALKNNLEKLDDPSFKGSANENIKPDSNDVIVTGFETCWYRAVDGGSYGSNAGDMPRDCDDLPSGQKRYVASATRIKSGAELGAAVLNVLTTPDLQGLYGAAFDPQNLPSGFEGNDYDGDGVAEGEFDKFMAFGPPPPSLANRDPHWGNFPASVTDTVLIQIQAIGMTTTGSTLRSNWMLFPVQLCVGCVMNQCGVMTKGVCKGEACGTGVPCPTFSTCGQTYEELFDSNGVARDPVPTAATCVYPSVCPNNLPCPKAGCPPDSQGQIQACVSPYLAYFGSFPDINGLCNAFSFHQEVVCRDRDIGLGCAFGIQQ